MDLSKRRVRRSNLRINLLRRFHLRVVLEAPVVQHFRGNPMVPSTKQNVMSDKTLSKKEATDCVFPKSYNSMDFYLFCSLVSLFTKLKFEYALNKKHKKIIWAIILSVLYTIYASFSRSVAPISKYSCLCNAVVALKSICFFFLLSLVTKLDNYSHQRGLQLNVE